MLGYTRFVEEEARNQRWVNVSRITQLADGRAQSKIRFVWFKVVLGRFLMLW